MTALGRSWYSSFLYISKTRAWGNFPSSAIWFTSVLAVLIAVNVSVVPAGATILEVPGAYFHQFWVPWRVCSRPFFVTRPCQKAWIPFATYFFPSHSSFFFLKIGGDNPLSKNCGASYTAKVCANHGRNSGRELATSDLNVSMEPNIFKQFRFSTFYVIFFPSDYVAPTFFFRKPRFAPKYQWL